MWNRGFKDKDTGIVFSKNKDKATLLNIQFQSVFSQFSLSSIDKLKDYFPQRFQCSYSKIPEINIDLKVILKLLSNLKPDKAPGPNIIFSMTSSMVLEKGII